MVLLLAAGCTGGGVYATCIYHSDCAPFEGCLDGSCQAVGCLSTSECPFGNICDQAQHTCVTGCEIDSDCNAGEACDGGSCVAVACDDALEDCGLGESCDLATGECEVPEGDWCAPCDSTATDACGDDAYCHYWEWQTPDDAYCLPTCDPGVLEPCPVGFICAEMVPGEFYCLANCSDLVAGGYY